MISKNLMVHMKTSPRVFFSGSDQNLQIIIHSNYHLLVYKSVRLRTSAFAGDRYPSCPSTPQRQVRKQLWPSRNLYGSHHCRANDSGRDPQDSER